MSERPEEALEWLERYCPAVKDAVELADYITQLEAENVKLTKLVTCRRCGGKLPVKEFVHCGCWYREADVPIQPTEGEDHE